MGTKTSALKLNFGDDGCGLCETMQGWAPARTEGLNPQATAGTVVARTALERRRRAAAPEDHCTEPLTCIRRFWEAIQGFKYQVRPIKHGACQAATAQEGGC